MDVPNHEVPSLERSSRRDSSSRRAFLLIHCRAEKSRTDQQPLRSTGTKPRQYSLERPEQLQQVRTQLSSVPRPDDEHLWNVDQETNQGDRPSDPVNADRSAVGMRDGRVLRDLPDLLGQLQRRPWPHDRADDPPLQGVRTLDV